ncbi:hypothetical protein AB0K89_13885 [Streptomyces cinnamoneus]|uniref:hypothetical protein n=1 Tax=Streptomyces cinnamoneus TaxID=53446 RepID=UPI0034351F2B
MDSTAHRARCIVRDTFTTPGSPFSALELHTAPAVWLLHPPAVAAAYGRRYADLYPGAWEETGIPATAFASADSWRTWATSDQPGC